MQAQKEARLETNQKTVISEKYHGFLDRISKNDFDTPFFHQKYDYKIILNKEQKYNFPSL